MGHGSKVEIHSSTGTGLNDLHYFDSPNFSATSLGVRPDSLAFFMIRFHVQTET